MIKGSVQKEDIINRYGYNIETSRYLKQILTDLKGETDSNIKIVGDFNTLLISMNRSFRQKINKETPALNDTIWI